MFQQKIRVVSTKSILGCKAGCGRTVSFSDRFRLVNDRSSFFEKFFEIFEHHFTWQAQYLVMLEGNLCGSAHCKRRFICDEDP